MSFEENKYEKPPKEPEALQFIKCRCSFLHPIKRDERKVICFNCGRDLSKLN